MPGSCLSHILLCALLEQLCVNVTFAVCVSACFPVQEVCVCMVADAIRCALGRLLSFFAAAVVSQLHSISTGIWQGQLDWHGAHVNGPCLCLVDISDNETLCAETAMTKQSKATLSGLRASRALCIARLCCDTCRLPRDSTYYSTLDIHGQLHGSLHGACKQVCTPYMHGDRSEAKQVCWVLIL